MHCFVISERFEQSYVWFYKDLILLFSITDFANLVIYRFVILIFYRRVNLISRDRLGSENETWEDYMQRQFVEESKEPNWKLCYQ